MIIPEPREEEEEPSGIWWKVDPQRQAECEIERDAACEYNGSCIHFPVPYILAHFILAHLCTGVRCRKRSGMELGR